MDLSVVVPAYNEEGRLPEFLRALIEFRERHLPNMEIVVVDDGSSDQTAKIVGEVAAKHPDVRLVSYRQNRGKGWAVRQGVMASSGMNVIFMDADGATQPDQIPPMLEKLAVHDVVFGSRRHAQAVVQSTTMRRFIGKAFNTYVRLLFGFDHDDSQCGFKGFRRDVARDLFFDLIEHRWVFDIEIYHKLCHKGYTLSMLPIKWDHKEGSKLSSLDPVKMGLRLLKLRVDMYQWERRQKSGSLRVMHAASVPQLSEQDEDESEKTPSTPPSAEEE